MMSKRLLYDDSKVYLGLHFPTITNKLLQSLYEEQMYDRYLHAYHKLIMDNGLIVAYEPWTEYIDYEGIHSHRWYSRQAMARSLLPLLGYFTSNGYYFDCMRSIFIITDDTVVLGPHYLIDNYRMYRRRYIRFIVCLLTSDSTITDDDINRYPLNRYLGHLSHEDRVFWGETLTAFAIPSPPPLFPDDYTLTVPPGFREGIKKIFHHYLVHEGLTATMMQAVDYYYQGINTITYQEAITLADSTATDQYDSALSMIGKLQLVDVSNPYWTLIMTVEHFVYVFTTIILNRDSTIYYQVDRTQLARSFMRTAHHGTILNRNITVSQLNQSLETS